MSQNFLTLPPPPRVMRSTFFMGYDNEIRGGPLMIWGGGLGQRIHVEFFFPANRLLSFFSLANLLLNFFKVVELSFFSSRLLS